jgi:hypothetical protein
LWCTSAERGREARYSGRPIGTDLRVPFLFSNGDKVVTKGLTSSERGVNVDGFYSGPQPSSGGSYRIVYEVELEDGGLVRVEEISLETA